MNATEKQELRRTWIYSKNTLRAMQADLQNAKTATERAEAQSEVNFWTKRVRMFEARVIETGA